MRNRDMERRLAAVLMADVAGYSRLMEADEAGTLAALKQRRASVLEPILRTYSGRTVKFMGDGALIEFNSALNAVAAAVDLQRKMAEANSDLPDSRRINLRVGINLGDVIGEGRDIYGEGVNLAARLQTLAEPGGICISGKVFEEVRGKLAVAFEDMGEQRVKNIERPVRTYRLRPQTVPDGASLTHPALPLPDKPSIAVLPFQNMSGDSEQEYFADGMVEEIITALSRMRWLFVIARNSSFTYKGRAVDVKQVGRELGVRYVLEGSVRKAGNRMRITGQLIDTTTGAHLWADRFDGSLEDVFDLQDQVTASVVGALGPKLEQAEIERVKRKPTESLDAYDYYLRGMAAFHQFTRQGHDEALELFYRAIELDPRFAPALGMASRCFAQSIGFGWVTDRARESAEAERLARRAAEVGKDDAVALSTAGFALVICVGDLDDGNALIERALVLNPNLAWTWMFSGWGKLLLGEPDAGVERVARAMRLSPQDPQIFGMQTAMAFAHLVAGRYEEALSWAEKAIGLQSNFFVALCVAAAAGALAGRIGEAERALTRLRQLKPALRVSNARSILPFRRAEHVEKLTQGLRMAGLPE
jgi:TolB-like protein/class 3 adenylate cyclase